MRLKPFLLPLIAYLIVLTLLMSLGLWQLDRAEKKQERLIQLSSAKQMKSLILDDNFSLASTDVLFREVTLSGIFDDSHQFLIDNQIRNNQVGYFVLTPFMMTGQQKAVLINRGWIKAKSLRTQLPDVSMSQRKAIITGTLNHFPSVAIHLKGAEIPTATNPGVVQVVDVSLLSDKINIPLHDFQVQLSANSDEGYLRDWDAVGKIKMTPEKHMGYALQWFAMAFVLTIICIRILLKNKNGRECKQK